MQMDWVTFIVSETKALAWPGVVLTTMLVLRRQISGLISELGSRLRTAKGGGVELSFEARIDEIQQTLPTAELSQLTSPANALRIKEIAGLSNLPPAYIVSHAWLRIVDEIRRSFIISDATFAQTVSMIPPTLLLRTARRQGYITDDEFHILEQLRRLHHQTKDIPNTEISLTDAIRYDNISSTVIAQIREKVANKRRDNTTS